MTQDKNRGSESDVSARFGAALPADGEPPRHGRRGLLGWKLLVMAGMLAAGLAVAAGTAVGQAVIRPSVPTNFAATVGDTEVLLSWESGGNGQNGNCPTTGYYVELWRVTHSFSEYGGPTVYHTTMVLDTQDILETSVHFDMETADEPGIKASTQYLAEVHAYGKECDNYSYPDNKANKATVVFTTNASNSGSDPTAPARNPKKTPARVQGLTADASGTSVTLKWKRPKPGRPAKRCDMRDSPSSNTVEYAYEIRNTATGSIVAGSEDYTKSNATGNTEISVTVSGLASGTEYKAAVSAYSPECDEWGRWRYKTWTQP